MVRGRETKQVVKQYNKKTDDFRVPANVKFEMDDAEEEWTFQEKFDFIHVRYMAAAIVDWSKLMRQAFDFTVPAGWAEFQDFDLQYYSDDGSLTENMSLSKWLKMLLDASKKSHREPCPGPQLERGLIDAGFTNVVSRRMRLPIGLWPKDKHLVRVVKIILCQADTVQKVLGCWNLVQIEDGLEGFSLRLLTQVLGWDPAEVQVLLAKVRKDLRNPKIHAQFDL